MRLVFISDTHTLHDQINLPTGDILIHSGDFSGRGTLYEAMMFNQWLRKQDFEHKLVICGNHEMHMDHKPVSEIRAILSTATYLHGEAVNIGDIKFWGGPWTPEFCNWAFNIPRSELKPYWDNIPDDTNVLITHGPPYNVLDETPDYYGSGTVNCGDSALKNRIKFLKDLKIHCFGHIHEQYGQVIKNGVQFINASTCNRNYEAVNPPIVVDL